MPLGLPPDHLHTDPMGFSLHWVATDGDETISGDRAGVEAYLASRGLHIAENDEPVTADGKRIAFNGYDCDFHFDGLDHADDHFGASVWHAHLLPEEIEFYFDIAVAGRLLIVNPQGDPMIIVCGDYDPARLPSVPAEEVAHVANAAELAAALEGNFQRFLDYKRQVTGS